MNNAPHNIPAAQLKQTLNVQLETFERAAYRRDAVVAGELMLQLVDRLRNGADFIGFMQDDPLKTKLYSRVAAAIVSLLGDPGFNFSAMGWAMFAVNHAVLESIFESSVFDTAEHLVPAVITNPEERDARKFQFESAPAMAKFLLTFCLNGQTELNFDELFSKSSKTTLPLWLGMLAHHVVLHPNTFNRRELLIDTGKYFEDLALPEGLLPALSDAYMYCSYLTRKDKHKLKASLSKMIRNMFKRLDCIPTEGEIAVRRHIHREDGGKPIMLIPVEWFNSLHAMYRCYAPSIIQLREHFHLVAAIKEKDLDAPAKELFDDFLWLDPDTVQLDQLIRKINQLNPDIIFYPSIGMALWWVALAQLRLAPIQVMGLGHPASSHSPTIDYVLSDRGMIEDTSLFTERILEIPANAFQFLERSDTVIPELIPENDPYFWDDVRPIKIAIPSMVVKITVPFMQMLRRINDAPRARKIEWHFFPNVLGIWRFQAKRQIERWLPGAVIHHRVGYAEYLHVLSRCDLHLSTFPFGGTNSIVDSMICGVPIVCLEGDHVHERTDAWAFRRVGMDDLITHSIEEYEKLASKLIDSNIERATWRRHLRDVVDPRAEFFGPLTQESEGAVARAFLYVMDHHEEIQAAYGRVVPWEIQRAR
jgi:hypothetical protein